MKKLLLATTNDGKIREIRKILFGINFEIVTLKDIGYQKEISETGNTFEENAVIKAKTVGADTGFLTVAEDSGLEIDALGGRPGVRSARYVNGTDAQRNNQVLKELNGIPRDKRKARFVVVVALYDPRSGKVTFFHGKSEGIITDEPKGNDGFGYDPIFFNRELGKTNAEAAISEKNQVSHRGRAFEKLRKYLMG